jgi:glycosyltransferase involved in cell wall biosynthesis
MNEIKVKVGLQQRVLPNYRVPFFDALSEVCPAGLCVFAGDPRPDEALDSGVVPLKADYFHARNRHLLSGMAYACWQTNIQDWLEEWQPQVLIMEANPRYPSSQKAINWMRQHGGRLIGWGLGSPKPQGSLAGPRLKRRKRFISQFDALITYSRTGAQEYAELGFPAQRIFSAPNAVAPKPTQSALERPPTYAPGGPVVLFVGRLQARKKVDYLICACAVLPQDQRPALWIVGDGPLRRELETLAEEIYPSTKFYGAQHGSELEQLFQSADLFVLPGTGGLAVQQAMAYALPVIVGAADGTQSDLVREQNGWILTNGSPQELSALIARALGNVEHLREMGAASYEIVSREVNLENMVAVFVSGVNSVLEV